MGNGAPGGFLSPAVFEELQRLGDGRSYPGGLVAGTRRRYGQAIPGSSPFALRRRFTRRDGRTHVSDAAAGRALPAPVALRHLVGPCQETASAIGKRLKTSNTADRGGTQQPPSSLQISQFALTLPDDVRRE